MSFERSSALESQPTDMRRGDDPEYRESLYERPGAMKISLT